MINKKYLVLNSQDFLDNRKEQIKKTQMSDQQNQLTKGNINLYNQHSNSEDEQYSQKDKAFYNHEKKSFGYPIVEFQQFQLQKKLTSDTKINPKKKFSIEVPEVKFDTPKDLKEDHQNDLLKDYICKEPPAPSKGSTKSKVFIFPTQYQQTNKNILSETKNKFEKNEPKQKKSDEKKNKDDISLILLKQREEFEKQKQKYQKQIMVKDGQIQMMQKLLSDRLNKRNQVRSINEAERIIADKDRRIKQLMQKIQQLTSIIKHKNEQLVNMKIEYCKIENHYQNLQNELYIEFNKSDNTRLTNQFYKSKGVFMDDNFSKSYWQQEQINNHNITINNSNSKQNCIQNIQDLQKRLNFLKSNRIQLQLSKSRNKHKSNFPQPIKDQNIWCSQTSKHKPKGMFDFKLGKQKERSHYEGFEKLKKKQLY